jgi:uncharacterized protein (TIGR02757 family)
VPRTTPPASAPRRADRALAAALADVLARTDRSARRAADPVSVVHRYEDPLQRELVALLAASVAFGNVKSILNKLDDLLLRLGPDPCRAADHPARLRAVCEGWVHRVYRGEDVAALLSGARKVQRAEGSLGDAFAAHLGREGQLRPALARFVADIRREGKLGTTGGAGHLLPDPDAASGCKRLLLFLRWMVRPEDGVDLGLWSDRVPADVLLIPVDTHIHKLSRNLGLTRRRNVSWRTAEEITGRLARLDPADPVRYDFALCHLGMLARCPSRRDPVRCDGCPVRPVCQHWTRNRTGKVPT